MFVAIIVILILAIAPVLLFFSLIGLTLTIWCWNRIGRYFVNFGRWTANWRNFVPLAGCGVFALMVLLLLFAMMAPLRTLWIALIVLNILIAFVATVFALIMWTVGLCRWAWPPYRRFVWRTLGWVWDIAGRQQPAPAKRARARRPTPPPKGEQPSTPPQPPEKRSALATFWDLMLGKPRQPARSTSTASEGTQPSVQPARAAPPAKRSWFGTFWALMLGKPQPKRQQTRPTRVQTTDQTLGQPGSSAAGLGERSPSAPPRTKATRKPRQSWFGTFWALMLGKPSKPAKRKNPTQQAGSSPQTSNADQNTAPAAASAGPTMSVGEAKAKPDSTGKEKAKGGFFGRMWSSIGRGFEWIRVRLNLD